MADFVAKIIADLDTSQVDKQLQAAINKIQSQKINIDININGQGSSAQNIGKQTGSAFSKGLASSIDTTVTQSALDKLRDSLNGKGVNSSAINNILSGITKEAQKANLQITKITESFYSSGLKNYKIQGIDELGNAVTILESFNAKTGKLKQSTTTVTQTFEDMASKSSDAAAKVRQNLENVLNVKLTNGQFSAELSSVNSKMEEIKSTSITLQTNIKDLNSAFETMRDPNASMDDRIAAMERYNQLLPGVKSQINQLLAEEKKAAQAASFENVKNTFAKKLQDDINSLTPETEKFRTQLEDIKTQLASADKTGFDKLKQDLSEVESAMRKEAQATKEAATAQQTLTKSNTLSNNIQTWMNNNTKAAERFGTELKTIMEQLNGNTNPAVLKNLSLEFANIKSQASSAGLTTNSFANSLKDLALNAAGLGSALMVVHKAITLIKDGINTVKELDYALVDLQKTTTMTSSELNQFYSEANGVAKSLGVTTEEIINQASAWSRLGYSSKEAATEMAKLSSMFALISPGMDVDTATEGLVSVMKAYGIQTQDVLDGIMSKINSVGNSFALNNQDITNGLERSAASLSAANNSFEESVALITAGTEITQNATNVGQALKTKNCLYVQKCAYSIHLIAGKV